MSRKKIDWEALGLITIAIITALAIAFGVIVFAFEQSGLADAVTSV